MARRAGAAALAACCTAAAWAGNATGGHQVPDTLQQRLIACTACHGKDGRATNQGYFPRIAGKPAGYLYNQLLGFRDGRRHYAGMTNMVEHMSDDYLRRIAEHFAALDLPYPAPPATRAPPALLAAGERLARHGDDARRLPACVKCHGDAMTGTLPATPGLLGLPRDYLVGQLGAWRSGSRQAAAPDCMAQIAKALSPDDIAAVSTWLAAQPLPPNPKAATAAGEPLPLRCGSALP
ncbi:MAG TPA: cytochrome c4 [Ideonella sp.]|uniref:c-type cytochrome n=1 Tax=Ideonella sp. TaxID=1929293 RepID=UPI002E30838B|nr:cytochrome c4 [Ideonella sp.]HEX5688188.1 cytochrome c4 [Ideonella sp.]